MFGPRQFFLVAMARELELTCHGRVHLERRDRPGEHVLDGRAAPKTPRILPSLIVDRHLDVADAVNMVAALMGVGGLDQNGRRQGLIVPLADDYQFLDAALRSPLGCV